jgi:hypothetical protein
LLAADSVAALRVVVGRWGGGVLLCHLALRWCERGRMIPNTEGKSTENGRLVKKMFRFERADTKKPAGCGLLWGFGRVSGRS